MRDERAEKMRAPGVVRDTGLLGDFSGIYCRGVHKGAERRPLVSDGVAAGIYGRKAPVVCGECAELLRYAERRRAWCPKDPKPFCSYCDTHCYKADMRERMRVMMRYAGPRSMLHGHAVDGFRHMLDGRRHKRKMDRGSAQDEFRAPQTGVPTSRER